jgi:hypothetical protein
MEACYHRFADGRKKNVPVYGLNNASFGTLDFALKS